eukprot:COSAG02_NODE_20733_length_817_cov_1.454039_1_plen_69_part_00
MVGRLPTHKARLRVRALVAIDMTSEGRLLTVGTAILSSHGVRDADFPSTNWPRQPKTIVLGVLHDSVH